MTTAQLLGPLHTIAYPWALGVPVQGMALPAMLPGEMRTVRADLTKYLASAGRTIGSVVVAIDPALSGSVATPAAGATDVFVTLQAGPDTDQDAAIEISLQLVPDGRVIWVIGQPVLPFDPALPDDPVTIGNQPLQSVFQPVSFETLQPLLGGAATGDVILARRPGSTLPDGTVVPALVGTLPAGSGGLGQVVGVSLIAAAPLSGHRAIMVDAAGQAVHADPSTPAIYNLAGISLGAAAAGAPVSLAQPGDTIAEPSWSWTPGRAVFVGAGGVLTQTAPVSGVSHQVGQALTATVLLVQPVAFFRL